MSAAHAAEKPRRAGDGVSTCRCCGRPLTSAASLAAGVGPTCGARGPDPAIQLRLLRAAALSDRVDGALVILDSGCGAVSVEGDVAGILAELGTAVPDVVIVRGRAGRYSVARHRRGVFGRLDPLDAKDLGEAVAQARWSPIL